MTPTDLPLFSFVTVNFNNAGQSRKLCESLRKQEGLGTQFQILCMIVDNSTEQMDADQCARLTDNYEWLQLIRSNENLGYFGGINLALGRRPQDGASFVIICNNDLEFDPDFCEILSQLHPEMDVYALCPDVMTLDGFHQNPHVRNRISSFRRMQFDVFFANYYVACAIDPLRRLFSDSRRRARRTWNAKREEIHMGVGACYVLTDMFFGKFEAVQCPSFLFGEEAFISEQIHRAGGKLVYEPRLHVLHAENASTSSMPARSKYELGRAAYRLYRDLL